MNTDQVVRQMLNAACAQPPAEEFKMVGLHWWNFVRRDRYAKSYILALLILMARSIPSVYNDSADEVLKAYRTSLSSMGPAHAELFELLWQEFSSRDDDWIVSVLARQLARQAWSLKKGQELTAAQQVSLMALEMRLHLQLQAFCSVPNQLRKK